MRVYIYLVTLQPKFVIGCYPVQVQVPRGHMTFTLGTPLEQDSNTTQRDNKRTGQVICLGKGKIFINLGIHSSKHQELKCIFVV